MRLEIHFGEGCILACAVSPIENHSSLAICRSIVELASAARTCSFRYKYSTGMVFLLGSLFG